jgi:RNase P subunit RPR2
MTERVKESFEPQRKKEVREVRFCCQRCERLLYEGIRTAKQAQELQEAKDARNLFCPDCREVLSREKTAV